MQRFWGPFLSVCWGLSALAAHWQIQVTLPSFPDFEEYSKDLQKLRATTLPSVKDFVWEDGRVPSQKALDNTFFDNPFYKDSKPKRLLFFGLDFFAKAFPKDTVVKDGRIFLSEKFTQSARMEVLANDDVGAELLRVAYSRDMAHETNTFVLVTDQGRIQSQIFEGSLHSIHTDSVFVVSALLEHAQKLGHEVRWIEWPHTHPGAQFFDIEKRLLNFSSLNPVDLAAAETLSEKFPTLELRTSAVTSNGFSYLVVYKNGVRLDPLKP